MLEQALRLQFVHLLHDRRPACFVFRDLGFIVRIVVGEGLNLAEAVIDVLGQRRNGFLLVIVDFLTLSIEAFFQRFELVIDDRRRFLSPLRAARRRLLNEKLRQLVCYVHRFVAIFPVRV